MKLLSYFNNRRVYHLKKSSIICFLIYHQLHQKQFLCTKIVTTSANNDFYS